MVLLLSGTGRPPARPPDHLNVKTEGKAPRLPLGVLWVTRSCLEATFCPYDICHGEICPGDICPGYLFLVKFGFISEYVEHFFWILNQSYFV